MKVKNARARTRSRLRFSRMIRVVKREAWFLCIISACAALTACSTANVTNGAGGPCVANFDSCSPSTPGGCGGDPNSASYDVRTVAPDAGLPIGCVVTSYDQNRDPQGNCTTQETCTCIQGAD